MLLHVLNVLELLDTPHATGESVAGHLRALAPADATVTVTPVAGNQGSTDFVKVVIPGTAGRRSGGTAPTLGIIGRLGGIGARPELIGYVSDGDGATAAISAAAKLLHMASIGDRLVGDVIVSTHVCAWAPTEPHEPVAFMGSPVDIDTMNDHEVTDEMEAILSIDTTKGNRVINHRGIAISPTVRQGYILRTSEDLLSILETVTGEPAKVFPLSVQDITPYGNGLHHLNSILQPAAASTAPVVGVAITAVTAVAGSATGASHETDIAAAARFSVEVAKAFGPGRVAFHSTDEFDRIVSLYGSGTRFQTLGESLAPTA
jgi:hypothetical protein